MADATEMLAHQNLCADGTDQRLLRHGLHSFPPAHK